MKHVFFLFLLAQLCVLRAQISSADYQVNLDKFSHAFNSERFDLISKLYSPLLLKEFPAHESESYFAKLRAQSDSLIDCSFIGFRSTYAQFLCRFLKGKFVLELSQDGDGKLDGIFLKPPSSEFENAQPHLNQNFVLPVEGWWQAYSWPDANLAKMVLLEPYSESNTTDGSKSENFNFLAFSQAVFAPAAGIVVDRLDSLNDHPPFQGNYEQAEGNFIRVQTDNGLFYTLMNLRKQSILPKVGDRIERFQSIAQVGNSGQWATPCLVWTIHTSPDVRTGISYLPQVRQANTNKGLQNNVVLQSGLRLVNVVE